MSKTKVEQVDAFVSSPVDLALEAIRKWRSGSTTLRAVSDALVPLSAEELTVVGFAARVSVEQLRNVRNAGRDPSIT